MKKFSELDNLQQFLDNEVMYSHFMDFCNLFPGLFDITNLSSELMIMNQAALAAANISLDKIVGHNYSFYRSKLVELSSVFLAQDQSCRYKESEFSTISWTQYGIESQWVLSLSIRKPIYGTKKNIIGIANQITQIDTLLGPLQQFCIAHKINSFFSFKKQFCFEISNTYPDLNLSARQAETLFFLLYGKSSKEIATILNLSVRTIESYIDQIKFKFNCSKKSELIEKSIANGYLGIFPKTLFEEISKKQRD